jgi:nucleotide-binding universal stress UspA family protein
MLTHRRSVMNAPSAPTRMFEHVLVGIDRSPESLEAARQAAALVDPGGRISLLAAWMLQPLTVGLAGPMEVPDADEEEFRGSFESALADARAIAGRTGGGAPCTSALVRGTATGELLAKAREDDVTLIVVGSHGWSRSRGILLGSTATEIVHEAPCSVLVTRPPRQWPPSRIVVGVDGSPESAAAHAAARRIADRHGSELWPVVAHGGNGADDEAAEAIIGYRHEDLPDEPVRALTAAAADADLVVVGSRGLHGLRALGSVSERVAHQARCSTLIVRGAAGV